MRGKLIVFEGLDYSFKETNSKQLYEYIKNYITDKVELYSFPKYDSNSSIFVKNYLNGKYGKLNEIDPYTRSMFYAIDRYDTIKKLEFERKLEEGYYIILDRYVGSNILYASTDYDNMLEKDEYIDWVIDLEYNKNKLPKEDITIYMNMPIDISYKLLQERNNKSNTSKDIHEDSIRFLKKVERNSKYIIEKLNWNIVNCTKEGELRCKKSIFADILNIYHELI